MAHPKGSAGGGGRSAGGAVEVAAARYRANPRAVAADARRVRAIQGLKANQRLMNDKSQSDAVRSRAAASMMMLRKALTFYRGDSSVQGMQLTAQYRKGTSSGRGRKKRAGSAGYRNPSSRI